MSFVLKLKNYQGPFEVLLQLLEARQLEITEIALAKITQNYLEYIQELELEIEEMNWFLYVAARLIYQKSTAILNLHFSDGEEVQNELAEDLKKYKILKNKAKRIASKTKNPSFATTKKSNYFNIYIKKSEFLSTYQSVIENHQIQIKKIRIQDRSAKIKRLQKHFIKKIIYLRKFEVDLAMSEIKSKQDAIIFFTTILELVKQQKIKLNNHKKLLAEVI